MVNKIVICGGGTAGLISALMLRQAFPYIKIDLVYSSDIGIIGVGEGSTEHWRMFMDICQIPTAELIIESKATHKYGIRYINWTNHTPDYFHSISGGDRLQLFGTYLTYNALNENKKLLTNYTSSIGLFNGMVRADNPHMSTNQFHFDTFCLNKYFHKLCSKREVNQIDAKIIDVKINSENGYVESVLLDNNLSLSGDLFIDATGFRRVLMNAIGNTSWKSYSDVLPINKAIPFPSPSSEDGIINNYTKAVALSSGWAWEIPTQERRGNGYAFSDSYINTEQAVEEFSKHLNIKIENPRVIDFSPGRLNKQWDKNVISIGLSSSFVEPLEATSIGSTIQQMRSAIQNITGYSLGSSKMQEVHNSKMEVMMENLVSMVRLHYISDREDTHFWKDQKNWKIPKYLSDLLEIWSERPPVDYDISMNNFELFHTAHFWHVAQGQGLISNDLSANILTMFGRREITNNILNDLLLEQSNHGLVSHAESLKALYR